MNNLKIDDLYISVDRKGSFGFFSKKDDSLFALVPAWVYLCPKNRKINLPLFIEYLNDLNNVDTVSDK